MAYGLLWVSKQIGLRAKSSIRVACVCMVSALSLAAQQPTPTQTVSQTQRIGPVSKDDSISEKRKLALLSVHSLANNILGFDAKTAKPVALARLADLIWKDEEPYARQVFSAAIDVCAPKTASTVEERKVFVELRRQVISLLARHDPGWAKRLIQEDGSAQAAERMEDNFATAYDMLEKESAKSLTFAELSLQDGVFPYMSSYLLKLRSRDEPAANALFLKTLARLVAIGSIDGNELLHLGTYVFTSPRITPSSPAEAVAQVGVGRFVVYDITADRPGVPLAIIRAYLSAASAILTNGTILDPQTQQLYYVAGYLLLPKAQKFAPELIGPMAAAMAAFQEHISPELRDTSTYASVETKPEEDLDETLADIEKLSLERQRNERYLFLVFSFWSKKEFVKARVIADKISDLEVRSKLNLLIDFGLGADFLDRGALALPDAEKIANKLPQDIERSVLWLGIARAYEKSGNKQRAIDAINEALAAARKIQDERRSLLVLCAAGQLAGLSPPLALTTLSESVRAFNSQKADPSPESSLSETVKVGYLTLYFALQAKGVEYSLPQALRPVASADAEGTLAAVTGLTDEIRRAQAFVVVAAVILK